METRERLVALDGAFNFRDLGGYPTTDGRMIRWGRLFRSDTLHELSEADVLRLRGMGLATVIDLRRVVEVERTGRGPLSDEGVQYRHYSVVGEGSDRAPPDTQEALALRYLWYLDVGRDALVSTLTMVGNPDCQPLVFHCTAGKDRTGVVAALVLELLGIERSVIAADYALTASRMDLILSRLRRQSDAEARVAEIPQVMFGAEAKTMETFLDLLSAHHGGARAWALAAGVPEESIDAMSALLVPADGAPAD